MTSDLLFVYGTLMRGYAHPMARLLSANADFLGEVSCRGRLYRVKHYPGLVLSDDAAEIVFGELYRLRAVEAMLREFDMYEACGEGFAEPTQYVRRMLPSRLPTAASARPGPISITGRSRSSSALNWAGFCSSRRAERSIVRLLLRLRGRGWKRHARFFGLAFCCM